MQRKFTVTTILSVSLLALACNKKPPEVPEIDEPEPPPAQVEEPEPPKPSCNNPESPCDVKEGEAVTFAGDTLSVQPPAGWTYVLRDNGVVASAQDGVAALGLLVTDAKLSSKPKASELLEALTPLTEATKLTNLKESVLKARLRKSPVVEDAGSLSLNTWDVLHTKVNGKDGMTLIILSELPSGKWLLGLVAIQKDAVKDNAQSVHEAYLSIKEAK